MPDTLRIIPLGGVGEVGKNITVIEAAGEILVVDCGLAFPEQEMLGIDLVIPDVTYLAENRDRVKAILLTHGHEDHTGGLPYVLPQDPRHADLRQPPDRWASCTGKLKEHKLLGQTRLDVVEPAVEFRDRRLRRHAVPRQPLDPRRRRLRHQDAARHGRPHRRLQVRPHPARRTPRRPGADRRDRQPRRRVPPLATPPAPSSEGYTLSEKTVGESLNQLVGEAPGRVIVATFASNIGRVQQVLDAAWANGRKMVALGRSMEQNIAIALELGYLDPREGTLIGKDQLQRLPKDGLVVMTTGSQGEPMSGLTRMSNRDHRNITIEPGDTVIISASPIPGNEEAVAKTIDNLFKEGAMVHYEPLVHCHVSGHGSREELKLMLGLVKPRHFIPVHGEYRMLVQHGAAGRGGRRPRRRDLRAGERAGGRVRRPDGRGWPAPCPPARCWSTGSPRSTASTASSCATGARSPPMAW